MLVTLCYILRIVASFIDIKTISRTSVTSRSRSTRGKILSFIYIYIYNFENYVDR